MVRLDGRHRWDVLQEWQLVRLRVVAEVRTCLRVSSTSLPPPVAEGYTVLQYSIGFQVGHQELLDALDRPPDFRQEIQFLPAVCSIQSL